MRRDTLSLLWLAGMIVAAVLGVLFLEHGSPENVRPASDQQRAAAAAPPLEQLPARPEVLARPEVAPIARDEARARNAAVPFATREPTPARPFRFEGSSSDRARAVDCLAIAAMAEAGASDEGQRSIIQVVLNRVRHPAFAKTVCGAVFQGSERATGCQFTFTCDGALARRYSESAWEAARQRAREALGGRVYAPVGTATHYHTDWVFPYWSPQLEKIARVETHLFFRWPGYWGSNDALRAVYRGGEPQIAALAALGSHVAGADLDGGATSLALEGGTSETAGHAGEVVVRHPNGGAFLVHLSDAASSAAALSLGRELCGGQGYCQVMGWTDRSAVPSGYPVPPPSRARLTFSYVLDGKNTEIVFYDCAHFSGTPRDSCIPRPRG